MHTTGRRSLTHIAYAMFQEGKTCLQLAEERLADLEYEAEKDAEKRKEIRRGIIAFKKLVEDLKNKYVLSDAAIN
jgi:hypothetical protein